MKRRSQDGYVSEEHALAAAERVEELEEVQLAFDFACLCKECWGYFAALAAREEEAGGKSEGAVVTRT